MKKLIDKEKVVSEIKRRIRILEDTINKPDTLQFLKSALGYEVERYKSLISYLDTMETTDDLENMILELPESIANPKNHQIYQLSIYHYDRSCCVDYVGELEHDSLVCFAESTFAKAADKMKNWIKENKIDKHLQIPDEYDVVNTTGQEQNNLNFDEVEKFMMNTNAENLEVKKGKSYICIEDWKARGTSFTKGKIYVCHKDRCLYDDFGAEKASVSKLFRLATKEEIKKSKAFRKGDWIVLLTEGNDNITVQIMDVEVTSDKETRYWISDNKLNMRWFDDKSIARPWNIKFDAKDGDILCTYECEEPKIVFILKGNPHPLRPCVLSYYCYYNIMYPYFDPGIEKGCLAPNDEDVKPATKEQRDTLFAKMKNSGYEWDGDTKKLMEIEQKPADKVEPKFHEGDWAVSNLDRNARQISEVHFDEYNSYYVVEGKSVNLEEYDRLHHLWTIADAQDGDVLSDGTTIFIFKNLLSDGSVMSYCDYDTDSNESDAFCPLSVNLICSKITPATKEQHNTLEKAMADAGYTFDFEKKEMKKIEQKPADKPEHKFKVGNWITNGHCTCQITFIDSRYWYSKHCVLGDITSIDKTFHLWSINDAQDGDVLATEPIDSYKSPFVAIYKNHGLDFFNSYCFIGFDGKFYEAGTGHSIENIHPATKEQRDTLFAKMKEASYEWDGDTKELMEIEQKQAIDYPDSLPKDNCELVHEFVDKFGRIPDDEDELNVLVEYVLKRQKPAEWSEDDERICQCIIKDQEEALNEVRNDKYGHSEIISDLKEMYRERINWLKNCKNRELPLSKQEWSEDDEEKFRDTIRLIEQGATVQSIRDHYINWFKSLRQRIG